MEKNQKVRLTLELPAQTGEQLEQLMERTHATSKSEVLRKALALLDAAVRAREEGQKVGAANPDQKLATEFIGL